MATTPSAAFVDQIRDKDDDEIVAFIEQAGGIEVALDRAFDGVRQALNPERARDCILQWNITANGNTYPYTFVVEDQSASVRRGESEERPRVTFTMSVADFVRILVGLKKWNHAFRSGDVHAQGDLGFTRDMEGMFRPPETAPA